MVRADEPQFPDRGPELNATAGPEALFLSTLEAINGLRDDLGVVINAVNALSADGQAGLATQLYKVWIACNRDSPLAPAAYFNLGVVQSAAGDLAGSKESLESALAIDPDFYPAHINLGMLLEKTGAVDQGVAQWQAMVARLAPLSGPSIDYKLTAIKQIGRVLIDNRRASLAEA